MTYKQNYLETRDFFSLVFFLCQMCLFCNSEYVYIIHKNNSCISKMQNSVHFIVEREKAKAKKTQQQTNKCCSKCTWQNFSCHNRSYISVQTYLALPVKVFPLLHWGRANLLQRLIGRTQEKSIRTREMQQQPS